MKTYQFNFVHPKTKRDDCIRFCAESKEEAVELCKGWFTGDEKLKSIPEYAVEEVYDPWDDEFYGSEYEADEIAAVI